MDWVEEMLRVATRVYKLLKSQVRAFQEDEIALILGEDVDVVMKAVVLLSWVPPEWEKPLTEKEIEAFKKDS